MNIDAGQARRGDIRIDLLLIAGMIAENSRVLDVGCGDGALLHYLTHNKKVDGRGIELSQAGVNACVAQGLSVIQGDADTDLSDYPTRAFDYVVLSQTLPAVRRPRDVLAEMLRIGRRAIVSIPNFGHWRVRLKLLVDGRMPITDVLHRQWYETPNAHFCTVKDFRALCRDLDVTILDQIPVDRYGRPIRMPHPVFRSNLFGEQAVFLLTRRDEGNG
jgi:methionine biosynthesis protein MetW